MNKYKYGVDDSEPEFEVETTWDEKFPDYIAEDAAKDYFDNHDGWEDAWPLIFTIFDKEDKEIGRFNMIQEFEPVYTATKIKESKENLKSE